VAVGYENVVGLEVTKSKKQLRFLNRSQLYIRLCNGIYVFRKFILILFSKSFVVPRILYPGYVLKTASICGSEIRSALGTTGK